MRGRKLSRCDGVGGVGRVSAGRSAAADRVRVWGGKGKGGSVFVTFYIIINLFKYTHQKFYFIKY